MKRITVSLPDELVNDVKRAAGGERQVSAYVTRALEDYQERERLDDILADWQAETPVPGVVQFGFDLLPDLFGDHAGLTGQTQQGRRKAG